MSHIPVMLHEVVAALQPAAGKLIIDGTFGRGGYSRALLAAGATVIGIDRDPSAVAVGKALMQENPRFTIIHSTFSAIDQIIAQCGHEAVDGITFDLGVSSPQIDEAERGFSFRNDGPLDMRMDTSQGQTAADLVNTLSEQELADILYYYGEEKKSRAVARAIIARRQTEPFTRTADLAALIRSCVRASSPTVDAATRSFQALRIAVNDELGELERALAAAPHCLKEDGRLAIVAFHSLEDRLVKDSFRTLCGRDALPSRHMPAAAALAPAPFKLVGKQPIEASDVESKQNPRARSARLRVIERLSFSTKEGVA